MANSGGKTPVSQLLEYLVSNKKTVPHFEFIPKRVGTHNPEFTCRIQIGTLWEEGVANSKQQAKHRAAEKMLKALKVESSNAELQEEAPAVENNLEIMENHVGNLKELCITSRYPDPKYYLEEAAGPAHSRVFKMVCSVSQLQDFGISKTKKQAKQQAAAKMLERLKKMGCKLEESQVESPKKALLSDKEITDRWRLLKMGTASSNKEPMVYYRDHHKAYLSLLEDSPTLSGIMSKGLSVNVDSSLSVIEKIAEELDVKINLFKKESNEEGLVYTVISMSVFPPIAAVGDDDKRAAFNLLHSFMIFCS